MFQGRVMRIKNDKKNRDEKEIQKQASIGRATQKTLNAEFFF